MLDCNINLNDKVSVECGKKDSIAVKPERSSFVFTRNDVTPEITRNVVFNEVKAPIAKGECVGRIEVYKDGIIYDTVNLIAAEEVLKADFGDNLRKVAKDWLI